MEEIVREEVLEETTLDTSAIDTEVSNIVERLDDISVQEMSNEEKLEAIDNTDVSGIPTEINQSVGVFDREDPYSGEAKNTPEAIAQSSVAGQDTIYKDLPQPTIASSEVSIDDMINDEQYGGEYGEAVTEGIVGDINKQVTEVSSEIDEVYQGTDGADLNGEAGSAEGGIETTEVSSEEIEVEEEEPMANGIVDDINAVSATENEDEETVETPEELEETTEDEVEEETTEEEVVEEESEEEEEVEEYEETESTEEVAEEVAVEGGEEVGSGEAVASVELDEAYGAAHVLEELTGDLRSEVEAIELVDNANTKMFDDISFMKDVTFDEQDVNPAEDGPEAMAALVTDGVGLQEGFDGETVPATGGASEGGEVETYEGSEGEETTEIENVAATESLGFGLGYTGSARGPVSSKNVLSKFWNGK